MTHPASLIINSPYDAPHRHWLQDARYGSLALVEERRSAGYEILDVRYNINWRCSGSEQGACHRP